MNIIAERVQQNTDALGYVVQQQQQQQPEPEPVPVPSSAPVPIPAPTPTPTPAPPVVVNRRTASPSPRVDLRQVPPELLHLSDLVAGYASTPTSQLLRRPPAALKPPSPYELAKDPVAGWRRYMSPDLQAPFAMVRSEIRNSGSMEARALSVLELATDPDASPMFAWWIAARLLSNKQLAMRTWARAKNPEYLNQIVSSCKSYFSTFSRNR